MPDITYMTAADARFKLTDGGLVSLFLKDKHYPKVDVYLSFPFSFPDKFISIRDEEGDEIALIRDLAELDHASQAALREELEWRYFTPQIERIESFKEEFGYAYWTVITNRGSQKIVTRRRDSSIRTISENRILILDVSGNRFEIPNLRKLDRRSRQYVEALL